MERNLIGNTDYLPYGKRGIYSYDLIEEEANCWWKVEE